MTGFSDPILGGDGALIRIVEKSDNYVPGVSGWAIFADGSCEFNSGIFRGTVTAGTFAGTNFMINTSGAFFYSGTPAAGNLIISIAPASGTDGFGNAYPAGINISGGGLNTILLNPAVPQLELNPTTTKFIRGTILASDGGTFGRIEMTSPINISGLAGMARLVLAGQPSGGGQATIAATSDLVTTSGPVIKTSETWQAPSYNLNWATGTTFNGLTGLQALRFRRDAEDNLVIQGAFQAGGTLPGAAVFQLPAGYRPASAQMVPCLRNNAGTPVSGMALINTAGNVDMFANALMGIAINNEYYIDGKVALGNIS